MVTNCTDPAKMAPHYMIILLMPLCALSMLNEVNKLNGTVSTKKDYWTVLEGKHFTALRLTLTVTYEADFYSLCSTGVKCFPYFIIGRGKKTCDISKRNATCEEVLKKMENLDVYKQSLNPEAASLVGSYCLKRQNTVKCSREISVSSGRSIVYSFCFYSCYSTKGLQLDYSITIGEINFTKCFDNNFTLYNIQNNYLGITQLGDNENDENEGPVCASYRKAVLPGFVGFNSAEEVHIANEKFKYFGGINGLDSMRLMLSKCYQHSTDFLCRCIIPECSNVAAVFPCKKTCEDMNKHCDRVFECDLYPETSCFFKEIQCGNISELEDGSFTVKGFGLGSNVNYTCNEGFEISGSPSSFCQANGTWSQKPPVCRKMIPATKYTAVIGTSICIALLLAIVMTGVLLVRRFKLRKRSNHKFDGPPCQFHAFVSYSSKDADFVEEDFRIFLEEKQDPPFHLCLHNRNFIPGQSIHGNIMAAIEGSAMCFIMLSQAYVKSPWCSHEFSVAYNRMVTNGLPENSIVMILLENIQRDDLPLDMKAFSYECTYIELSNKHFWVQVLSAVRAGTNWCQTDLNRDTDDLIRF